MRVLLATDGSEVSQAAVRIALEWPWPPGSTLRVMTVVEVPYFVEAAVLDESLRRRELENAELRVAATAESLHGTGLNVETVVREGDPRPLIVQEAERWHADLILIGSHGRSGMRRFLMGSVAEYVVRHAPCSVEVARGPAWAQPPAAR
jgi:nucleotide-binding universal stress UspA family protein